MGIFLDVPKDVLDFQYKKKSVDAAELGASLEPPPSLVPTCGFLFWENPPHVTLTPEQANALVGAYMPLISPDFFSPISITRSPVADEFMVVFGGVNASYVFAGSENSAWYVKSSEVVSAVFAGFQAFRSENDGTFTIGLVGIRFKKE